VIISARIDAEAIERARRAGADAYLTKPLRFPELLEQIEKLLA
jgi:CheY-like chemotaxis protein